MKEDILNGKTKIFLSYVRADTEADTGRLFDTLSRELPGANLFLDVADIELGANWKRIIERAVEDSVILLCIMGPGWRLSPPIYLELTIALKSNVPIVPILFRGADLIALTNDMEADIAELKDRNAISINHKTWLQDISPLIVLLKNILADPLRARVIIDPPNPENLLKQERESLNVNRLLNYAQDLAECLDDNSVFEKAKKAALHFDSELKEKWKYDSEMIRYGGFYQNFRAADPTLIQIVEAAKKRLKIELNITQLIRKDWSLRDYEKIAQYLDDKDLYAELVMLNNNYSNSIEECKNGGYNYIVEAKEELNQAVFAAINRLKAELPGITKRYPDRNWPVIEND